MNENGELVKNFCTANQSTSYQGVLFHMHEYTRQHGYLQVYCVSRGESKYTCLLCIVEPYQESGNSVSAPVTCPGGKPVNPRTTNQPANQLTHQTTHPPAHPPINPLAHQTTHQPTNHPTTPRNHPTSSSNLTKPTNQSNSYSPTNSQTNQPINQLIYQLTENQTNQPKTDRPINQQHVLLRW